jgi:ribosomal-protein-alanine N-acetyltransferase
MPPQDDLSVRALDAGDLAAVRRILDTSDYLHYRFDPHELSRLLGRDPAVGAFASAPNRLARLTQGTLRAFLLINWLVPPSAWIGGFGVTWSEGERYARYLDLLLPPLAEMGRDKGAHTLYYSGSDLDNDWLREAFEARGFLLDSLLRSYDKEDYAIPWPGNTEVRVRPFVRADAPAVVAVEGLTFPQLWRHDAASFLEVAGSYPYFAVAEDDDGICGYQYNAVDASTGYLVRIAVHPRVEGRGVGARLMAEAIRYFEGHHVWKIVLNTEETNTRAHALYERFGFHRIAPVGFVLALPLTNLPR